VYVLSEQAEMTTSAHQVSAVGSLFTAHQAKDRSLAGAVASDQPNVFARIYLQRSTTQNVLGGVRLRHI
jgi:hypothetical protein